MKGGAKCLTMFKRMNKSFKTLHFCVSLFGYRMEGTSRVNLKIVLFERAQQRQFERVQQSQVREIFEILASIVRDLEKKKAPAA